MTDVQLNLTGAGRGSVVIGGQDVSAAITHLELSASAGKPPTLIIEIKLNSVLAEGDLRAQVDPVSRLTLLALGWTEPAATA